MGATMSPLAHSRRDVRRPTMSAAERLAELGELLAVGIQRFLARESKSIPMASSNIENSRDRLDAFADAMAPCGSTTECP